MSAGRFDPFNTKVDPDTALRLLRAATDGADDGELFLERRRSEVLGFDDDQRGFDFAGAMLKQLGVSRVRIMTNNPVKKQALADAGLDVVAQQSVVGRPTPQNARYLEAKRLKAGHSIDERDTSGKA